MKKYCNCFYYITVLLLVIILVGGSGAFAATPQTTYIEEITHPIHGSDMNAMLTYGERIILSESIAQKKIEAETYIAQSVSDFSKTVEASLPKKISARSNLEIQICRLAQLYNSEGTEEYAKKAYNALVRFAQNHYSIVKNITEVDFAADCYTIPPVYLALAYDYLYYYPTEEFDSLYNTDTHSLIENWLYDTAALTYNNFITKTASNLSGYTVKHLAGIAAVLNNPEIMRWAIFITDKALAPELWHADGMWWEGSASYSQQLFGNLKEVIPMFGRYKDPDGYVDNLLNIKLDGKDISSRWPIISFVEKAKSSLVHPDGTIMAVHDTHPTYNSVVGLNLPIKKENLSNVELNHFGLFGLKTGDTSDAQQVSMLFPPLTAGIPFSGGHYHGNFLTMSLWAGGQELLPDAGYPFQVENYRYFHMSAIAHNCSWIWDNSVENYDKYAFMFSRPDVLRYDDGSSNRGNIQLIEASQPMAEAMNIDDKRRLLMLVKTSENTSYVFDLQQLKGGDVHENFLRASEDEDVDLTVSREAFSSVENLGEHLKSNGDTGLMAEQTLFTNASLHSGEEAMNFTFTGVKSGSNVRVFTKGVENSTIAFSSMPSLRRTNKNAAYRDDFPTKHFYQRREVTKDTRTRFAAVYEGNHAHVSAKIKGVQWEETAGVVFACIDLGDYEDIICISDNCSRKEYKDIVFASEVAWVRRNKADKKVLTGYIHGGGTIYTAQGVIYCEDGFDSKLVSVERQLMGENSAVLADSIPSDLVGNWGHFTFSDSSGISHKILEANDKILYTHNDVGFELENSKATFTSFPTYQTKEKTMDLNQALYANMSLRTIDGDVYYHADRIFYGIPQRGVVIITEDGEPVTALQPDTKYKVKVITEEENCKLLIPVYRGKSNEALQLCDVIFTNVNGNTEQEFKIPSELFENFEDGSTANVKISCILWDEKFSPLCNKIDIE